MRKCLQSDKIPKAVGPYSQAVITDNMVFVSGQIPVDIESGKLIEGTIKEKTNKILNNINVILKEANSDLKKSIKLTIYLKDMNNFAEVNEEYAKFFISDPPARACVEVSRLPKDVDIEIDCIAKL